MDPDALEYKTWLQLKECTLVAAAALKQITAEGADDRQQVRVAREALEKVDYILSTAWEGPAE